MWGILFLKKQNNSVAPNLLIKIISLLHFIFNVCAKQWDGFHLKNTPWKSCFHTLPLEVHQNNKLHWGELLIGGSYTSILVCLKVKVFAHRVNTVQKKMKKLLSSQMWPNFTKIWWPWEMSTLQHKRRHKIDKTQANENKMKTCTTFRKHAAERKTQPNKTTDAVNCFQGTPHSLFFIKFELVFHTLEMANFTNLMSHKLLQQQSVSLSCPLETVSVLSATIPFLFVFSKVAETSQDHCRFSHFHQLWESAWLSPPITSGDDWAPGGQRGCSFQPPSSLLNKLGVDVCCPELSNFLPLSLLVAGFVLL